MRLSAQYPGTIHSHPLTTAIISILATTLAVSSVHAQSGSGSTPADLDTVVVTGIRGSLQSSMNLKRDSIGVVDGIIAEDIGKFPDTNLAESLQRISGVSIDRTDSGEGSKVTVRGVGPDFNLVLLNGRQMPATSLGGTVTGSLPRSRSFDFSNLASEAVSELEVYKTVHANMPTGGIGATLNIKTVRPLDNPGLHAQVGGKGVMDRSVDKLPNGVAGSTITPEISGIFSNTWLDGRLGIAVNASYQKRDSGYNRVDNERGWFTYSGDVESDASNNGIPLPQPSQPAWHLYHIDNQPGAGDIYGLPQDLTFSSNGVRRQRRNGQVVLQFSPVNKLTATLDYTYAQNKVQQHVNRSWVSFGFLPGMSSWTDGPVAGPILYSEQPNGNATLIMAAGKPATRSELKSLGFNLEWQPTESLSFTADFHTSKAKSLPDGIHGSGGFIGAVANIRRLTTVDFSRDFPIFNMQLAPGVSQLEPEHAMLGGSLFQGSFNWSEVKQGQANGTFRFSDYQALDFGVANAEVSNRSAASRALRVNWNGVGTPDDYADDIFQVDHWGGYFNQFKGHDDPGFTDRFLVIDYDRLRQRAIEMGENEDLLQLSNQFNRELQAVEKTRSAFVQWRNTFDWAIAVNVAAGVRYEKTKVSSPSTVRPPASHARWSSNIGDLNFVIGSDTVVEEAGGEYDYWLPSLDIRADLRENLLLRGSYGKSIGRANWNNIQGGTILNNALRIQEGTGELGNPGILPLESKNIDLSLEWYYGTGSYLSLGYFRKNIKNFISNTTVSANPYGVRTPVGGGYWNNALSVGGCQETDYVCIREYIFIHHQNDPGVEYEGLDADGRATRGTITGLPTDPLAVFNLTSPANQRSDTLDGWELNLQHMFANSGFGMALNYTKVDSGLTFDNARLGDQYPMEGLSDTANLVAFYDKDRWQVRVAYNWRDDFLYRASDGTRNPWYVESYGQIDANMTWAINDNFSVFVEGINLTNETQRIHSRHHNMLISATQTGPRYMFGLRYKF